MTTRAPRAIHPWLEKVTAQLRAAESLPAGWDSHSAPPPDSRAVSAALELLRRLTNAFDLPLPHVIPTPAGGVQLEWENGPCYFEIEVAGDGAATYFFRDETARQEASGEIPLGESLDSILGYVQQATL